MNAFLIALVTIPLLFALHDLMRRPSIRRQAVRNISRHRGEAILVIAGTLLGTAIITASFVVGDSLEGSIRDLARTELGPVDEVIVIDADQRDRVQSALDSAPIPNVDGVLVIDSAPAAVTSVDDVPRGEPRSLVFALDVELARNFGLDPPSTGLDNIAQPAPGEAVLGSDVAETLGVAEGDRIVVHMLGSEVDLTVSGFVKPIGLAGRGNPVFVHPSVMANVASTTSDQPRTEVLISNTGDVFEGAELTGTVIDELDSRLSGLGVTVEPWKADLLADAELEGNELSTLFAGIGSFAVIAGILLLVNLFTMLAEERRADLGVMRAIGTRRNVVVRHLGLEGSLYAVVSAVLGVIVGAGVGWMIMLFARSLLERDGLELAFTVDRSSLVLGALIGLAISLATVWITSIRLSRLNIIRAIRQLPEPSTSRSRRRSVVMGAAGFAIGAALFALGMSGSADLAVIVGPAISSFSTIAIFGSVAPRRVVVTIASLAAMGWGLFAFTLLPTILDDAGIFAFVVQGLILVGGAVLLVTTHGRFWTRLAPDRIASRLGLANSLAHRTRTGLLLSMYALVIFMITFMAVFTSVFSRQVDDLASGVSAGHDLIVDTSPGNPVSESELVAVEGVDSVSIVSRAVLDFSASWSTGIEGWTIAGAEPSLFANGAIDVIDRAPRFASDEAALTSIFEDPNAIVVSEFFLVSGDGPGGIRPAPGDVVHAIDPSTGRTRDFVVAAVTTSDWVYTGPLVSAPVLDDLTGNDASPTRAYVALDNPDAAEDVASVLDAKFIENGAVSTTFVGAVDDEVSSTEGFIRILSGYLGLGLVIGIAGLGVVLVRGVRERRREIGMLRSIGVTAATVRRIFLVEAGFIGALGALIGTGLGLLTGYQVVTKSTLFGETSVSYVTPWTMVIIVTVGPLVASLLAAVLPANRAARLRPAEALRLG